MTTRTSLWLLTVYFRTGYMPALPRLSTTCFQLPRHAGNPEMAQCNNIESYYTDPEQRDFVSMVRVVLQN